MRQGCARRGQRSPRQELSPSALLGRSVGDARAEFIELAYEYPGSLAPPDSEHYFKHPVRVAQEMGLRAAVYCMRTSESPERETTLDGAEVRRFTSPFRLLSALIRARPRLAHGHSYGWIPSNLAAPTVRPYVFTPHVYRLDSYSPIVSEPLAHIVSRSTALIALTRNEANQFNRYAQGRVHIIPHPIDVAFFSGADQENMARFRESVPGDPLVATVANLSPKKNLEVLLRAFAKIKPEYPKAKVVIAGGVPKTIMGVGRPRPNRDTYLTQLEKLARVLGIESSAVFLGHQGKEEVRALYHAADVYALPSLGECQSLTTGEAAASGLPLVLSRIETFEEQYGDAALYFDPTRVDDLADQLRQMLSDRRTAKRLASEARQRVRSWDLPEILPRLRAVYEACMA